MNARSFSLSFLLFLVLLVMIIQCVSSSSSNTSTSFSIEEATLKDIKLAFNQNKLTSRQLVKFYFKRICRYNSVFKGVIEVNPDALFLADKADRERKTTKPPKKSLPILHGIPILVKDNIATKDKLNTTAGSFAFLGSVVPRDAGVVTRLRKAGAIILVKASLSEWSGFRTNRAHTGWNPRAGQGLEPYTLGEPCGSSSGSAISVAANMAMVSLGTETDASILCPSTFNSVVGIKPTIGLTSRSGVVPISLRQDTVGPICRTVSDAAYVLDAIVGIDKFDKATYKAFQYIPKGGYGQFLKADGLKGKRLGIVKDFFSADPFLNQAFEKIFTVLRKKGAILVDKLQINNFEAIASFSIENAALLIEFKTSLNAYLKELVSSPIRSLSDAIAFNNKHSKLEKMREFGHPIFVEAEATNGSEIGELLPKLAKLSRDGLEKTMVENKLDAIISPDPVKIARFLAIGGFPGITIPAGYTPQGKPFGIVFGGLKGFEPKLIEIAYGFEQATMSRKLPPL